MNMDNFYNDLLANDWELEDFPVSEGVITMSKTGERVLSMRVSTSAAKRLVGTIPKDIDRLNIYYPEEVDDGYVFVSPEFLNKKPNVKLSCEGMGFVDIEDMIFDDMSAKTAMVSLAACSALSRCAIIGGDIGVLVRHQGCEISSCTISDPLTDCIRVHAGYARIINNLLRQETDKKVEQHRDLLQIVAASNGTRTNEEFNKSSLVGISVIGNTLTSSKPDVQGIIFSDGILLSSEILGNRITVETDHGITLNRVMDSTIRNNVTNSYITIGSRKHNANDSANNTISGNSSKGGSVRYV